MFVFVTGFHSREREAIKLKAKFINSGRFAGYFTNVITTFFTVRLVYVNYNF